MNTYLFETGFKKLLMGRLPFPWQEDLYHKWFIGKPPGENIPAVANLPTGLGKTSVIAVWLLALLNRPEALPRRLVYVVNRRTVVDQTTSEVNRYRHAIASLDVHDPLRVIVERLGISTLRGQFADNREWAVDPSRPAVICGTVDMIGSRLLFEGYRIGFKSRPMHGGFLGQDTLLVHDEAHLEPAFQQLVETIQEEQKKERERNGDLPWPSLRVLALSATARDDGKKDDLGAFQLTSKERQVPAIVPEPRDDEPSIHEVWRRLSAKKSIHLHPCDDEKNKLAGQITEFAIRPQHNSVSVLIFVRKVDDVGKVVAQLKKKGVSDEAIETLTGTMRGLERDRMADPRQPNASRVFARFLPPPKPDAPESEQRQVEPMPGAVYLVCTSAGEVGVNLSADHMVCDLSTFDSMAQRLGRVNRFGDRDDTRVDVIHPALEGLDEKHPLTPARKATLRLLEQLKLNGDACPKALGTLMEGLTDDEREAAFAPKPGILHATGILFDAWALTTIRDTMPGRPPAGPYLHGVEDDLPQTTIAWRTELDLVDPQSPGAEKVLQAILTKHRIRPHETLTANSHHVADFLKKLKSVTSLHNTTLLLQFPRGLQLTTLGKLIDDPGPLRAEPTLVLPASFGGLDENGTLSLDAIPAPTLDIADHDGYEPYEGVPTRMRLLIVRSDDGWSLRALPGGRPIPEHWVLDAPYAKSTELINTLRQESKLNVRLVQPLEQNEEGEAVRSLICLSPAPPQGRGETQSLADHVAAVEKEAVRIAEQLHLPEPYRAALLFAAKWHDEGKKAPIWQRYIGGNDGEAPLGKSATWRDPKLLAGYRHEFGSLLRILCIPNPPGEAYFADPKWGLTPEQQAQALDLALHMIAAHHGYARPHFEHAIDHDFTTQQCQDTHIEVMRRYARLQRRYGRWGLAYLESLLRAADAAASRAVGIEPSVDDDLEGDTL